MNRIVLVLATVLLATSMVGCLAVATPAAGWLYTDVQWDGRSKGPLGNKSGKACATSILGMFATGDASLKAAATAGGVTDIQSTDHHTTNLLGIIGTYCTIVRGS